jgi:tyrosyl-tRNA synthetase
VDKKQEIHTLLTRGVAEVIPGDALQTKLLLGKPLRIKFGIDPTSPNIHLGRATAIWKLRQFQDLGHKIVFIIGDFTGIIGDTSDKESERPMLAQEMVEQNLATYFEQAGKILDMDKVEKHRNSEWLDKLTYRQISEHANIFALSDFISRENIKVRLDAGKRVSLRELLYPLMQGYDSVAIDADVEIGGTDQKFNLLAGRKLQEHFKKEPQNILMMDIIEGLDGRKMSSSWGNTINLTDSANDMFGKVMSLRDELIVKYFTHTTQMPLDQIEKIEIEIKKGGNPRDAKLILAEQIVSIYHGAEKGANALEAFIATFQNKEIPEDILEVSAQEGGLLMDILFENKIVASKSEWRRLVEEGGVKRLGEEGVEEKITDAKEKATKGVYKIGKRRFLKIS